LFNSKKKKKKLFSFFFILENLKNENEKLVEYAIGGICNCCLGNFIDFI